MKRKFDSEAHEDTVELMIKRPARRQQEAKIVEQTQKVHEGVYNIWYNRWTGQQNSGRFDVGQRAPTRVNIQRDQGYTLADKRRQQNPAHFTYFCLMFARGCCIKGHKCSFLHRIPLPMDKEITTKDCFGRDRHRDEREDMNGVGSFNRENKTLYIGNINPYEPAVAERVIRKNFECFGTIDKINVLPDKQIGFVKFLKRANAEFAKEAMEHQTLNSGETIVIRWAFDDPNPGVVAEEKNKTEKEFVDKYLAKRAKMQDTKFLDPSTATLVENDPIYKMYSVKNLVDYDDD